MNNKIERIRNVNELHKTGDLTDSQSMEMISNILSEKGFYKISPSYKKETYESTITGNRRNAVWTKQDDHLLMYYINKRWNWKNIANKLHRTADACRVRATTTGLYEPKIYRTKSRLNRKNRAWTNDEKELLKQYRQEGLKYPKIAKRMGRTVQSVRKMGQVIGITRPRTKSLYITPTGTLNGNRTWTEDEDNKLRKYVAQNYSFQRMAMRLGRSRHAIECRKNILGLKYNPRNLPYKPSKPIQSWEDDEVIKLYELRAEGKPVKEIAQELNRSVTQVRNKLSKTEMEGGINAWKAKRGYN